MAGKTLVVSLPSKWASRFNVKKGDEVEVEEAESKIIINTKTGAKEEKTVLDTRNIGVFDENYIAYLYQRGYDEIEVRFDDEKVFSKITSKLPDLLGFEIVKQGESYCLIKSISEEIDSEFDNILRRTFLMLLEMSESCLDAIKKKEYERLKEIRLLEKTNNKFTDFCKRILHKKGYGDNHKTINTYAVLRDLEKIGDIYRDICNYLSIPENRKVKISDKTMELFEEVNKYLRLFYELFYKFDKDKATKLHQKRAEFINKGHGMFKAASKGETIIIHYLINLSTTIFELYGPYFAMNAE